MTGVLDGLVHRRLLVYGGGLALVLLARTTLAASPGRALAVSVVLAAMLVTYAGELWLPRGERPARPRLFVPAVAGVVAGFWLVLTGRLPGLLFVGGGLLFCKRAIAGPGGDRA
jgi:hypothetical protein